MFVLFSAVFRRAFLRLLRRDLIPTSALPTSARGVLCPRVSRADFPSDAHHQRFEGIAALVDYRRKDLMKISQDQMDFLAQRNNPRGKKTMKAYYWYICGLEWDSEHPRP